MAPLVREDRIVVLQTGSRTTRAGHGVHELFQRPSVQVSTRVGRRRWANADIAAERADDAATAAAAADGNHASSSSNTSALDFIVGSDLDALLERNDGSIEVIYPIQNGRVRDWDALLAIWRHVLLQRIGIRTAQNDCPLLVSLPPNLSRDDIAQATRLLFETFNVPNLAIAEEGLLSAYAGGVLTATVVDFGWEHCTVSPVMESTGLVHTAVRRSDVGIRHVALYLAHLLEKDESIVQALIKLDATRSAQSTHGSGMGHVEAGDTLALRLFELASDLISQGKVRATVQGVEQSGADGRRLDSQDDEAEFDIAAALVAGRERAAIEEQERKNRAAMEEAENHEAGAAPPPEAAALGTASTQSKGADSAQKGASDEEGAETIEFQGLRIRVAPQALDQACEPLWDPTVLQSLRGRLAEAAKTSLGAYDLGSAPASTQVQTDFTALASLPETIMASINVASDVDRRSQMWESLLPTGAPLKLITNLNSSLAIASQQHLASNADNAPGTAANPHGFGAGSGSGGLNSALASAGPTSRDSPGMGGDIEGGAQPTTARCMKTPDYFAEFKDRTDLAPFLGATIYAKLAFTDPYGRLTTSKAVYNEKGPSASFLVSAPS